MKVGWGSHTSARDCARTSVCACVRERAAPGGWRARRGHGMTYSVVNARLECAENEPDESKSGICGQTIPNKRAALARALRGIRNKSTNWSNLSELKSFDWATS